MKSIFKVEHKFCVVRILDVKVNSECHDNWTISLNKALRVDIAEVPAFMLGAVYFVRDLGVNIITPLYLILRSSVTISLSDNGNGASIVAHYPYLGNGSGLRFQFVG